MTCTNLAWQGIITDRRVFSIVKVGYTENGSFPMGNVHYAECLLLTPSSPDGAWPYFILCQYM